MTSEEPARAPFSLPEIQVNPSGWGPSTIETKFKDMPYQPFSKSDRLGKVCNDFLTCHPKLLALLKCELKSSKDTLIFLLGGF